MTHPSSSFHTLLAFLLFFCAAAGEARSETLSSTLSAALNDHVAYSTGFRTKFRTGYYEESAPAKSPDKAAATLDQIQAKLKTLSRPEDEAFLLLYHVGPSETLAVWLVSQNGVIATGTSPAYRGIAALQDGLGVTTRAGVRSPRKRASGSFGQDTARAQKVAPAETLQKMADQLLPGPVGSALASGRGRLMILPAADVGSAPYPALPLLGEKRVVDQWSVLVLPDIHTLTDPRRVFDNGKIRLSSALIVGDPDLTRDPVWEWKPLPGARREAESVADLLGIPENRVLIGAAAQKERVMAAIDGYGEADLIYFASHAIADPVNPMDGGFVALTDSHLYGRDLRGRRFEAWGARNPLVVLSACQTGLGKTFAGGGYGVARAWISAGAGQVVASLWNVDDDATAFLMKRFIEHLMSGKTTEDALRLAQLRASEVYPTDPGAWASFVVMGAPGQVDSAY